MLALYPVSVPNYLQKHLNFILLAKKKFPGKKYDFQILLITLKRHHRGYENRLFNVLSRLSAELSAKTPKFRFASNFISEWLLPVNW